MKIRVEEYIRPDGSIPYKEWFDGLDGGGTKKRQQADIDRALALHVEYKARKAPAPDGTKDKKRKR